MSAQESTLLDLYPPENLVNIPPQLKELPNWIHWRREKTESGRDTKVPYIPGTSRHASSDDSSTWTTFEKATESVTISSDKGLGIAVNGALVEAGIVGFDLDGCYNPETGEPNSWAKEILDATNSYTEITPSGNGLRIWARGKLPEGASNRVLKLDPSSGFGDKVQIEIFAKKGYLTVTGDAYFEGAGNIETRDIAQLYKLCEDIQKRFPAKIESNSSSTTSTTKTGAQIERSGTTIVDKLTLLMTGEIKSTKPFIIELSGNKLEYHSPSEADLALYTQLAIKHGDNPELIENDFKVSPLYKGREDKCDRLMDRDIAKGIKQAKEIKEKIEARAVANAEQPALVQTPQQEYAMSPEEIEAELDKEFPRILLTEPFGPEWSDDMMYGPAREVVEKMAEYNEGHPAAIYLNLLVSLGNAFGRHVHFRINSTDHYTNEFLACVGQSSYGRKGSARDTVNQFMKLVDPQWTKRILTGFGSGEAIINEIRDSMQQSVAIRGKKGEASSFQTITVPGVEDKRLCIRESELSNVFTMASKDGSLAGAIIRNGWDGNALGNTVKGKSSSGFSMSARCEEPHLSITGDISIPELKSSLPEHSESNGFGNRFLYCHSHRTKKCPNGGPEMNWEEGQLLVHFYKVVQFAKKCTGIALENDPAPNHKGYMPLSGAAEKAWSRMYLSLDEAANKQDDMASQMTARGPAHIRRLAVILALIDLSNVVETHHLQAARDIWEYCEDSAQFIFRGSSKGQDRILTWVKKNGPATVGQVRRGLYHGHKESSWVRAKLFSLVQKGQMTVTSKPDERGKDREIYTVK
jgi:hypothetical protein